MHDGTKLEEYSRKLVELDRLKKQEGAKISIRISIEINNASARISEGVTSLEQESAKALLEARATEIMYQKELKECSEGLKRCFNDLEKCHEKQRQTARFKRGAEDEGARVNSAIAKLQALEQLNKHAALHSNSRVYKCEFQLIESDSNTVRNTLRDYKGGPIWGHQIELTGHKPRKLRLYLGVPLNEGKDAFLRVGNGNFVPIKDGLDSLAEYPLSLAFRIGSLLRSAKGYCSEGRKYHKRLAMEVEEERADAAKARQEKIASLQKKIASLQDERNKISNIVDLDEQLLSFHGEEKKLKSKIEELKIKRWGVECKKRKLGIEYPRGKVAELNKKIKEYVNCDYKFELPGHYDGWIDGYTLKIHNERDNTSNNIPNYTACLVLCFSPRDGSIEASVRYRHNDRCYYKYDGRLDMRHIGNKEEIKRLLATFRIPFSSKEETPSSTLESTEVMRGCSRLGRI